MEHTAPHAQRSWSVNYDDAPLLVIWETTRACALACQHCRASAIDSRHPEELDTEQGKGLLEDIARMGTPVVVFTGGDPLQRDDLEELIAHAHALGLRTGAIPAATPRCTRKRILQLKAAGLDQMALSLDASNAQMHDQFRGVEGSFEKVIRASYWAHEAGIPLQINSVMSRYNLEDFDRLAQLVQELEVVFWEVFFLVPMGRGRIVESCSEQEYEEVFAKLWNLAQQVPFVIKVTEAPHYRRFVQQHLGNRSVLAPTVPQKALAFSRSGINSGKGFMFIDHTGAVCPSGFLPVVTGNVKQVSASTLYREHPVFQALRDPEQLIGKCRRCEYRDICGGSRARAFALTGDMFAPDPCCAYEPTRTYAELTAMDAQT